MVKLVENQYKDKINSILESHNALIEELNDKNWTVWTNYNQLFEKHEILSRDKEKESNTLERWIIDL